MYFTYKLSRRIIRSKYLYPVRKDLWMLNMPGKPYEYLFFCSSRFFYDIPVSSFKFNIGPSAGFHPNASSSIHLSGASAVASLFIQRSELVPW